MRKFLILALPLILSGCLSSAKYELDPQWRPLEEIRERPSLIRNLGSKTSITTVGKRCYVHDLDEYLSRKPPGSPQFQAVMRHEQEHSRRQHDYGVWTWIARYGVDREFALLEEQIGFYYQMTVERGLGIYVDPRDYAARLAKYKNISGKLISFEDALAWAQDVLAGRWTPPED